ncbi:unnamed protein product [Oppiella nova]|uniref:Uncharacterized protein n=1 Tax=Oppiella nova TaxID=334625 RepID=A0A7R9QG58_9ACAR|nr:unnamed protein product [Oppiella nova]CAG2165199.1 unnamed protein product [Oppiella nova]
MVPIPDAFVFVGDFMSKPCDEVSDLKGTDIPKCAFTVDMFPMTTKLISNFHLATNPVNIYIDGRHLCLSAFPYIPKLRKHMIHNSTEESAELGASVLKLMASNGHLSAGLSTNLHSCLSLFHLPDFVLIADKHMNEDMDSNAYDYIDLARRPELPKCDFNANNSKSRLGNFEIETIHKLNLNPCLKPWYQKPVLITQGYMQYVWDNENKRYLVNILVKQICEP